MVTMSIEYILEYLKKENNNFSFEDFFTGDNTDKRAVMIVTPNQMFVTMILKDNDDNVLTHEVTSNYVISSIYNYPFKGDSSISEELEKKYLGFFKNQCIIINMYNSYDNKLIWGYLPTKITKNQVAMLESLEKKYSTKLINISKKIYEYNKDRLVGVCLQNNCENVKIGDSFKCIIDFIKENKMVKEYNIIPDYHIIGDHVELGKRYI